MTELHFVDHADELAKPRLTRSATAIREQIRSTEASGDKLLEDSADLLKAMVAARRQAGLAPHTGQKAIMHLAKAQRAIIAAQNDIFRVHDELVGIQAVLMPDEDGSTPPSGLTDEQLSDFDRGSLAA